MHDYHLWLDPEIVNTASTEIVKLLIQENPNHEAIYKKNLENFIVKLDELDQVIKSRMLIAQRKNFIVTHNAYQYFINRYHLNSPKAITIDHDHNIGAKSFLSLQHAIKTNQIECIFEEPQFESKIIDKLKENSQVKIGKLDAEWGAQDTSIEEAYFVMMNNLSENFLQCLK